MYIYTHTSVYTHMQSYIYIHTYIHKYTDTRISMPIHPHTHSHTDTVQQMCAWTVIVSVLIPALEGRNVSPVRHWAVCDQTAAGDQTETSGIPMAVTLHVCLEAEGRWLRV